MLLFATKDKECLSDQEYMERLYWEYHRMMYTEARKYTDDPAEQQDIVQESCMRLVKNVSTFRGFPRCKLGSYIVSTIRNTSINTLRRKTRVKECSIDDIPSDDQISPEMPLDYVVAQRERFAKIWGSISEEDRLFFEAKYILGQSDLELAKIYDCKPESIRMKLSRARRKALEIMEQIDKEDNDV